MVSQIFRTGVGDVTLVPFLHWEKSSIHNFSDSASSFHKFLGFSPSFLAMKDGHMDLGFVGALYVEDDICDLTEDDIWGDYAATDVDDSIFDNYIGNVVIEKSSLVSGNQATLSSASVSLSSNGSIGGVSVDGRQREKAANFSPKITSVGKGKQFVGEDGNFVPLASVEKMHGDMVSSTLDKSLITTSMATMSNYCLGLSSEDGTRSNGSKSCPIDVPSWWKATLTTIKGMESDVDDDEDNGGGKGRLPPHELLAKQYAESGLSAFSVIEGAGRTLKGRDASKVRDAVWIQTGFSG